MNKQTQEKLSPKQIENWRRVLSVVIGPYALIMPDEYVQAYKDKMQKQINEMSKGE